MKVRNRSRAIANAIIAGLFMAMLALSIGLSYLFSSTQANHAIKAAQDNSRRADARAVSTEVINSEKQWCDIFILLTRKPVPPPQQPVSQHTSQAGQYAFYLDLLTLKKKYHCEEK